MKEGRSRSRAGATSLGHERHFNVTVKLVPTNETFPLKNIYNEMKIKELKSYCEFATGMPSHVQRLNYLDQGDLMDHLDVRSCDLVPSALLHMDLWHMWRQLVEAAASNDIDWVFRLGVTSDNDFQTPNSQYMGARAKQQWLADRAFVALYVASHRGHYRLCEKLIEAGANVNGKTPLGRSPLHVAAARGHGNIVDMLLEQGADINAEDENGDTALTIAGRFGHKDCERHLFLFRWQQRAKQTKTQAPHEMFAHQYFDSAIPVWLKGTNAQIYYTQILPPGEFEGSGIGAPKRPVLQRSESSWGTESEWDEDSTYDPTESHTEDGRLLRRPRGERAGLKASGMPAIREETPSSRQRATPHSAQSGGSRSGSPPNKSKSLGFGFSVQEKKAKKKAGSFDEWLKHKKADEQVQLEKRRQVEEKIQLADDDKKRQAEFQDKSYDQWLAEKEADNRKTKAGGPATGATTKLQQATGGQTTDEIIRKIVERREQDAVERGEEAAKVQEGFQFWLTSNNTNLFNHLKSHGPGTILHL